jgi:hypothetical protein
MRGDAERAPGSSGDSSADASGRSKAYSSKPLSSATATAAARS